jgi:solute:Na+ symporter, SSS family
MKPMRRRREVTKALLGPAGIIFMGVYLASLILVGLAGRFARRENSMSDFYLSNRGMGLFVLFLTLYATQYSGLTLIGFAGNVYRQGYFFLVSVTFSMSIIGAYLVFAPKLHRLSKQRGYITIGDYLQDRFDSTPLVVISTILFIIALGNYILTNLKAIGYIVVASTGGQVTFAQGIIALSLIMVIYETLGGLRSVAWTDAIQGVLLLAGCALIFGAIHYQYGGLPGVADNLMATRPDFWQPPTAMQKRLWLSTLVIVFFGPSIYPHAIQRIYAAKNEQTLRRAFQIMVFMPIFTTLFMVVVGIVGASRFPGLDRDGSEQISLILLSDMAEKLPAIRMLLVLFLSAAVAAIMSTVDSALLAISSLFTQDLYRRIRPTASQSHLTQTGKIFSWAVMGLMAYLAIQLPQTLWRLTEIKLEILCQAAPAIFLGVHLKSVKTSAILSGLVVGTCIGVGLIAANIAGAAIPSKPWGIHAGVWGLAANFLTIGAVSLASRQQTG